MSPHVGNFVQDLVEMAKATEELPQVRQELERAKAEVARAHDTIASREIHILQLKQDIDNLNRQLREAEVAKDAAETMFLEADDRTTRALEFIKTLFGNAGALIQALEPAAVVTRPEPMKANAEVKPEVPVTSTTGNPSLDEHLGLDQRAPDPTPSPTSFAGSSIGEAGQSESHPTADASPVAESTSVTGSESSASAKQPEVGPYTGTLYVDYPNYIPLDRWLAGGGTEADYHWRPATETIRF